MKNIKLVRKRTVDRVPVSFETKSDFDWRRNRSVNADREVEKNGWMI